MINYVFPITIIGNFGRRMAGFITAVMFPYQTLVPLGLAAPGRQRQMDIEQGLGQSGIHSETLFISYSFVIVIKHLSQDNNLKKERFIWAYSSWKEGWDPSWLGSTAVSNRHKQGRKLRTQEGSRELERVAA